MQHLYKLKLVSLLTLLTFLSELAGGYFSNSISLLSDSLHLFFDLIAILISSLTILYPKFQQIGTIVNLCLIYIMSFYIIKQSFLRCLELEPIQHPILMLGVAIFGLISNLFMLKVLGHHHQCSNVSIKGVSLHILSDAYQSISVIAGSLLINLFGRGNNQQPTRWEYVDPLLSISFSILIALQSIPLLFKLINHSVQKSTDCQQTALRLNVQDPHNQCCQHSMISTHN